MSHQLTIRYDDELSHAVEGLARHEGISRNQAVLRLLRRGAGLDKQVEEKEVIGSSLDWFVGSWSEEEAREFAAAVAGFEGIDAELWK